MKHLIFYFLLIFSFNAFAIDPAITEENNHYYYILKRIEVIKNKALPSLEREKEFVNFANEFGEPGANWQTLKIGVLEIIIADSNFWAQQIIQFPAIQEKLIKDFEMDWYADETSNYPEKLDLAKIELIRELEKIKTKQHVLNNLLNKLNSVKPTSL
jgi:hypothetical protein